MATGKRELFDAAQYDAKMTAMIEKLRTQKPGQLVGMIGKKDVLTPHRAELKKLFDDGYTLLQIAEAMKNDVFSILPKTLTEVIQNKTKKARSAKKVVEAIKTPATPESEVKPAVKEQTRQRKQLSSPDAGGITITEDTKDL